MLQVGQTIHDRYQLQQKLGHNAGRQTWLAADLGMQAEPVIVKLLAFGDHVEWDDLKLFEREAQILRQLQHPRIPKCRDYFSIDDRLLWFGLVQDYIPGISLRELIQQGRRFTEEEVHRIAIEVLQILIDLHRLNPPILHRDIKPSNLILSNDEQIFLVDFGAVQDRASVEGATFTVVGTYGYTPMEQFGGRAVPASDLYALGASLIHLLTGICPADLPQKNLRIQFRDRATLSPHFVDWLEQLTHADVGQRFESATQAKTALLDETTEPEVSFSAGILERPRNTPVRLHKTANRLEIIIPKRIQFDHLDRQSHKTASIVLLVPLAFIGVLVLAAYAEIMLFLLFAISSTSLVWIIFFAIALFFIFIHPVFERTRICFDRKNFVIQTQRFSSTTAQIAGITKDVRDIRIGTVPNKCITITSGPYRPGYRYDTFGQELTDFERAWLVQEIRKWLKLRSTEN